MATKKIEFEKMVAELCNEINSEWIEMEIERTKRLGRNAYDRIDIHFRNAKEHTIITLMDLEKIAKIAEKYQVYSSSMIISKKYGIYLYVFVE